MNTYIRMDITNLIIYPFGDNVNISKWKYANILTT